MMSKDKLIMEIEIETLERSMLETKVGTIVMIPFKGSVKSDLFSGEILPGAVDTQLIDANNIKHMSARYMIDGKDASGMDCKLYIENTGYFHIDFPRPFHTIPKFYTDSELLSKYLHTNQFRGEGHRDHEGLKIKIYEIL
ncbi:DUF3237 family protein [Fusibacter sp. 3D3]|uniref:DUF3237 family protein n=1 Tax=Fusibacter sp. 3D3 TaxID=1048380 RepID=UPI000856F4BD|nr:DUF3237 family protein [Fusibacter sp. 3D3]GAU75970.1 hypothetical protein F3D3_0566 [Fusibacter sp. 3D3]